MNNNHQCKAYAALCAPLVAKRRAEALDKRIKLAKAQMDPDPHRDVVMKNRKQRELMRFGTRRINRGKAVHQ